MFFRIYIKFKLKSLDVVVDVIRDLVGDHDLGV